MSSQQDDCMKRLLGESTLKLILERIRLLSLYPDHSTVMSNVNGANMYHEAYRKNSLLLWSLSSCKRIAQGISYDE